MSALPRSKSQTLLGLMINPPFVVYFRQFTYFHKRKNSSYYTIMGVLIGGCGRCLGCRTRGFQMSGLEECSRTVRRYFATLMATAQVVDHLGYPNRQCPETLVSGESPVHWPYAQTHHPAGETAGGDRTGAERHAEEARCQQLGMSIDAAHNWVGHARRAAWPR